MALLSGISCPPGLFSCLSTSRATIGRCYSGISCPPSPPGLAVEELKNRHGFGPWLMFADAENDKRDPAGGEGFRRCYSFSSDEIFSLPAPHLQGRRCWGTQYGWLVAYCSGDGSAHLFNPLTHRQLPLPSRHTFKQLPPAEIDHDYSTTFFRKFSFSSDLDRLVVMSIYETRNQLAFCSPGDEAWKYIYDPEYEYIYESDSKFLNLDIAKADTIFYKGQFYSIDLGGKLMVCDITSGKPEEKLITTFGGGFRGGFFLVEISGHLHLICKAYVKTKTKSFDIYRLDFQHNKWISIDDLDGHALFVGNNTTFAISAADYPEIKPNCIYFTDGHSQGYGHPFRNDTGVYDFATKSLVEPVPFIKGNKSPYSEFSRPFFFIPSLSDL